MRIEQSLYQCRGRREEERRMQEGGRKKKRELVGKDLLLGKGTVSFQAINKGTLWEHKQEGQMMRHRQPGQLGKGKERESEGKRKEKKEIPRKSSQRQYRPLTSGSDGRERSSDVGVGTRGRWGGEG